MEDNVQHARERLTGIFVDHYTRLFKDNCKSECIRSVEYILGRNLLWGDALTLKTVCDKKDPIIFSEWSPVNGSMMKRRDYTLASLIQSYLPGQSEMFAEPDLFSDLGDAAFIPNVKQDFPTVHFLKIGEGYE
jgi:hypothetical protein